MAWSHIRNCGFAGLSLPPYISVQNHLTSYEISISSSLESYFLK